MSHRLKLLVFCMFFMGCLSEAMCQESSPTMWYSRIAGDYIFGAQVYNEAFAYKPGFQCVMATGIALNSKVNAGIGVNYSHLQYERFVPVFAEITGSIGRKDNNARLINMQFGYAPGWYKSGVLHDAYVFSGGMYFCAGLGLQINITQVSALSFMISYRHQFARLQYELFGNNQNSEVLHYEMLTLGVSFRFLHFRNNTRE